MIYARFRLLVVVIALSVVLLSIHLLVVNTNTSCTEAPWTHVQLQKSTDTGMIQVRGTQGNGADTPPSVSYGALLRRLEKDLLAAANGKEVQEMGYWLLNEQNSKREGAHNNFIMDEIFKIMQAENLESFMDLGCGDGWFAEYLRGKGLKGRGVDGSLGVYKYYRNVEWADLTMLLPVDADFPVVDVVMSFEVAEHIPPSRMLVFLHNIANHARYKVVITWAKRGQGGVGHVNELDREEVEEVFLRFGFSLNEEQTGTLRQRSSHRTWWLHDNAYVFDRVAQTPSL